MRLNRTVLLDTSPTPDGLRGTLEDARKPLEVQLKHIESIRLFECQSKLAQIGVSRSTIKSESLCD